MSARRGAVLLVLLALSRPAWPHAGSNAFLFVDVEGATIHTRLDLAARDLDEILALDRDGDGHVTWREIERARPEITRYARDHLRFGDTAACVASIPDDALQAVQHVDGWYAVVRLEDRCPGSGPVTLEWSGIFDVDASHRAQVRIGHGGEAGAIVLSPGNRSVAFDRNAPATAPLETARRYFTEGVRHVLTGLDHLLFLAGLFLPVALERTARGWSPVSSRRVALGRAAWIVSAFTASHAFTVCLVALGTIHPPTRVIESLVAASVAFAGLNNLVPIVRARRLAWLAGAFGFIHGAAIGGALLELGLPIGTRALALAAFNVGVECAQLLPAALAVLLTFRFRARPAYRHWILVPGSAVVTAFGSVWLVFRAFGLPSLW